MNVADLKLSLLYYGIDIDFDSIDHLTFKSDKYLHNNRHFVPRHRRQRVPQELIIKDRRGFSVCVGVLTRPGSPYWLKGDQAGPFLLEDGRRLPVDVEFVGEPSFWELQTSDGVPIYSLLSVPGLNELSLWPWHDCALHYDHEGCAFCTTTGTAAQAGTGPKSKLMTVYSIYNMNELDIAFSELYPAMKLRAIEAVSAALRRDFKEHDYWLTLISGNLREEDLDAQHFLFANLLRDLLTSIPQLQRERVVVNIMPAKQREAILLLKEAGAVFYMANLEIWDQVYFERICPGKARYGREDFIGMLRCAVQVFGPGYVWCNFVCGLEPPERQLEGYETLARIGVVAGANLFHKDPAVKVDFVPGFGLEEVRRYYLEAARILRSAKLKPFYGLESRRSSVLWEAYLGVLGKA